MTSYDWQTTVAFAHRYACACIPGYVDDECEALRAKLTDLREEAMHQAAVEAT